MRWINVESEAGPLLQGKGVRLIPFAQTTRMIFPGNTAVLWSRPTAILAQIGDAEEVVLPIRDVTREAQLTILGLGIVCSYLLWLFFKN